MPEKEAYLYLGHGMDLCDKNGKPILKTVPPGNLYITVGICGLPTSGNLAKLIKAFINPQDEHMLRNPDKLFLQLLLLGILDASTLHIHRPGDTYVDNLYFPVSEYRFKDGKQVNGEDFDRLELALSGILPLSKAPALFEKGIPERKQYKSTNGIAIPLNEFDELFQYSIYPKVDHPANIKTLTPETLTQITDYYSIRTSKLLQMFPGIHYNFLCRNVDPSCTKGALLRRRQSAVLFKTQPETYTKTMANDKAQKEEYKQLYGKETNWVYSKVLKEIKEKLWPLLIKNTLNISKDLKEIETLLDQLPPDEVPMVLSRLLAHIQGQKNFTEVDENNKLSKLIAIETFIQRKQDERKQKNINLAESEKRKVFLELQQEQQEKENRINDLEYQLDILETALQDCTKRRKNLTKKVRKLYGSLRRNKTPKVR